MKGKTVWAGMVLILLLVMILGATKLEQKKQEAAVVPTAGSCDTADLTLLERMYFDVLNDGRDESIELYTSAKRCPDGLMGWDTGQRWLLLVRNEEKSGPDGKISVQ